MLINLYFIKVNITFHNPVEEKKAYLKGQADNKLLVNVCNFKSKNLCNKWLEGWQDSYLKSNSKLLKDSLTTLSIKNASLNKQIKYKIE